jgi:23S rRNA pseudouridine1911/1915/1917 synthase
VGDPVYGRKPKAGGTLTEAQRLAIRSFSRQALHARQLILVHPNSGRTEKFTAPLPADLAELLDLLSENQ